MPNANVYIILVTGPYINAGSIFCEQQVTGVQIVLMNCGRFAHTEARGRHYIL